jgi:sarcosine oxidase subunit beta
MGKQESDEEDPQVDWSFLDQLVEHSMHRAPALAEAGIKSGWAGLRSLTPDDDPILGEAPHLRGFFNDCGWGGHGVMNAPGGGMVVADLIACGATDLVDVRPFRADRFQDWL